MDWLPLVVVLGAIVVIAVVVVRAVHVVTIHDYERGLRFRRGRLAGVVDPGVHVAVAPFTELRPIDVRPVMLAVEGQEVLTADGVAAKVSLIARYVVGDPVAAVTRDADFRRTLYLLVQLGLRDAIARRTMEETLAARRDMGAEVRELAAGRLTALGVELVEVDIRDVMLPGELKRAFASVIVARKEGEAALERARAETAALRGLANAGRMLDENPGLLHLRILQEIGGSSGNSVVFGAPAVDGAAHLPGSLAKASSGEPSEAAFAVRPDAPPTANPAAPSSAVPVMAGPDAPRAAAPSPRAAAPSSRSAQAAPAVAPAPVSQAAAPQVPGLLDPASAPDPAAPPDASPAPPATPPAPRPAPAARSTRARRTSGA